MKTIFIDYETYYDREYSLRKMTPVEYVLDHRFECIGCAVKEGLDGETYWVDGADLPMFFADLDADDTMLVSHNALFDACITAWRFNFHPRLTVDTLGIARATIGHECKSLSLANVALKLGIGVKGGTVHKVEGMGAAAIKAAGLYDEYIQYAINDADLCSAIYRKLVVEERRFPIKELVVMDMVLRCAIEPQMQLDQNVLALHHHTIKARKEELLQRVSVDKSELMSNDKFAQALRNLGVDPPMKTSLLTGKETFAFSKTDPAFMDMLEHDDPQVQALVTARLGLKSTLEETRTERFMSIARLTWQGNKQGLMPMPLRYSGAHTHRLSGDWSLNVQNMPRGGALRRALIAPPDYVVLASDASQIEARIVAWIADQLDLVEQFARGEDVYSSFASKVFDKPINKKEHPAERFIGKTAILGLGYGLGWTKFQRTVKMQSKAQTGKLIDLSDEEAVKIVQTYRDAYSCIPALWRVLNDNINVLATGNGSFSIGPCVFEKGAILLPNGLRLHYHDLKYDNNEWTYTYAGKPKRLYGGALLENIVQALARIVVMDAATRLRSKLSTYDVQLALQVHDELVYVVPEEVAKVCEQITLEEMSVRPSWAPTLPLAAEASYGPSYGDAK
jgi:DNA polymerase